jgi:hypothetical protein
MDATNAVRQARFRSRQRDDRCVYRVEVDRDAVVEMLVGLRRLTRQDAEHRDRVEQALSLAINEWARDE